ncbi:hypothetical protein CEXT_705861 [Caerostris extrusa]|uniref:Transmembrane protein n=1 Tax=Caerostris extrusa TaxID=172846 RepID=A0AAV4VQC1_CAEEX|nr:hypothetical protein CEXT_705861 [Caerostris extrusa]
MKRLHHPEQHTLRRLQQTRMPSFGTTTFNGWVCCYFPDRESRYRWTFCFSDWVYPMLWFRFGKVFFYISILYVLFSVVRSRKKRKRNEKNTVMSLVLEDAFENTGAFIFELNK